MKTTSIIGASLLMLTAPALADDCADITRIGQVMVENFSAERNGDLMSVRMKLRLDSMRLKSNQQTVLTPCITAESGDTLRLPRVYINGRNAQIQWRRGIEGKQSRAKGLHPQNSDIVEQRRNGKPQSIDYSANVAYADWMEGMQVSIIDEDCGCGRLLRSQLVAVGQMERPATAPTPLLAFVAPEAKVKTFELEKTSYIDFIVDRTDLRADYRRNPIELDSIFRTIMLVKDDPNITINNINIHGYASPESPYEHNTELASGRAATLKEYVSRLVDIPSSKFSSSSTPEDWKGLIKYLKTDMSLPLANRAEILVLAQDESLQPDKRESEIKRRYPADYQKMLKEWYPALRRSDYRITYTVRGFSLEEAKQILKEKPSQLSLNELYMVATSYPDGSPEFKDVMKTAVSLFPNDPVANLNAALASIEAGDLAAAERYLLKADDSAEAENARGAVAWLQGDTEAAAVHFKNAKAKGLKAAEENLTKLQNK